MKNIIVIIFVSFIAHLCINETENKNISKLSKTQLNQLLIDGQLDSLFNNNDTLILYLNLSGCIDRRYDIIRFYRISNAIFIRPEIKITFGEEKIIQGKEKKYSLTKNDTLSFEYFTSLIHRTLSEGPDSLKEKSGFMSIGVSTKWGKTYFSERMTEEHSRIFRLYIRIMHEIYPEMEEYKPIQIIEIIEDDTSSLNILLELGQ
jgi:hypothetical protein